jgi:hypothetical protein
MVDLMSPDPSLKRCVGGYRLVPVSRRIFRGNRDHSMPLTRYLQEGVFDPAAIEVMATAFGAVCKSLQLATRVDPLTEIVARKVIEIAGTGERDPARIHELTLLALQAADKRSA